MYNKRHPPSKLKNHPGNRVKYEEDSTYHKNKKHSHTRGEGSHPCQFCQRWRERLQRRDPPHAWGSPCCALQRTLKYGESVTPML